MALIHIDYGALASSEVMNNNFEYLDNKIAEVVQNSESKTSAIYSNIATLNGTFSTQTEQMINDISELKTYAEKIREDLDLKNDSPDYSKGVGISLPYTVTTNGYVFVDIATGDANGRVNINGKPVLGHQSSQYGGIPTHVGGTFRVSTDDTITATVGVSTAYFYPLKGV